MAKIKTRRHVDVGAVDRRLQQIGLAPGLVMRHDAQRGEYEIETADESISAGDLQRVLDAVPDAPGDPDAERRQRRARRSADAAALLAKPKWSAVDNEAAVRLLLESEIERG